MRHGNMEDSEVPGRVGLLLPATEFSVVPGSSTTMPPVLPNRGLDADIFALSVEGIPSAWMYAPTAAVSLAPGQQQEVQTATAPVVADAVLVSSLLTALLAKREDPHADTQAQSGPKRADE